MKNETKIAWLIGSKLTNEDFDASIRERGYETRSFEANQISKFVDEIPDLIILAEDEMKHYGMVTKFSDFYPGTPVMCLPNNQIEMMIAKRTQKPDNNVQLSLNRLIETLQQIEERETH